MKNSILGEMYCDTLKTYYIAGASSLKVGRTKKKGVGLLEQHLLFP